MRSHEAYDWMNPFTAHVYMKYALGSYGWMWYLAGGCWKGLCTLKKELVCFSCFRYGYFLNIQNALTQLYQLDLGKDRQGKWMITVATVI